MITQELMIKTLEGYKELKALSRECIKELVGRMVKDNHFITEAKGFAFYIKCNDAVLEKVRNNPRYVTDPVLMKELLDGDGHNVHFIGVYSTDPESDGFLSIVKGIEDIIIKERPQSISWYNRHVKKFIIRRFPWVS